jgi:pimeloyl-ACP methyl ester carboxylesterase
MVFMHGLCDSHLTWLPLSRAFEDRRLLLLDLPGHGMSGRPDAPYTPEYYADVVGAWWDELGLEDVHLVGHSYGGAIAQMMLLSRAPQVSSLTLLAPGGHGPEVGAGLKLMTLPGAEAVMRLVFGPGARVYFGAQPGYTRENAAQAGWQSAKPGTARAVVRTVRAVIDAGGQTRLVHERAHEMGELPPTAMLWGDADPIIPVSHATRAATWLRDLDLRIYPGVGHFPHLERTKRVARDMAELLDGEERRRVRVAVDRVPPRRRPTWIVRAWRWMAERVRRVFRARRSKRRRQAPRALPSSNASSA